MKVMNNKKLTARRYLEQIQEFDIYINQDLERLEEMKINACSTGAIDYSKDRVQTSPSGDTLCKQVTNYVAFNDKINAEIDSFTDAKEQIIKEIRGLRNKNYVQVLYKVYTQLLMIPLNQGVQGFKASGLTQSRTLGKCCFKSCLSFAVTVILK